MKRRGTEEDSEDAGTDTERMENETETQTDSRTSPPAFPASSTSMNAVLGLWPVAVRHTDSQTLENGE